MPNRLDVGETRHGALFDFNAETPNAEISLERSEKALYARIFWHSDEDVYASWFMAVNGASGKNPIGATSKAPNRILLQDSHGTILLVGCRPTAYHANMFGPGSGTLRVRAGIYGVDGDVDYGHPHGLRTYVSGLRQWLELSSWERRESISVDSRSMIFASSSLDVLGIGRSGKFDLAIETSWGYAYENGGDQIILEDRSYFVSRTHDSANWTEHLEQHESLRDLLVISRWTRETCREESAMRLDDPLTTLNGGEQAEQWRKVVVAKNESRPGDRRDPEHLIRFSEIGTDGIEKWLRLRVEFRRALVPILTSIRLDGATPNTLLAHSGPGLEALGYLLMIRDGMSPKRADRKTFRERLGRIQEDVDDCAPFDYGVWVGEACAAYNGVKHADRQESDHVDVLNVWRRGVLTVRAWVALELGIDAGEVKSRLARDPRRRAFVKVE